MAERRRREDEAPRLIAEIPELEKLDLEITDKKGVADPSTTYVRRVVVASAPALFEIPCGDPSCKDGGHDVTYAILRSLKARQPSFSGEDRCHGSVAQTTCGRVLHWVGTAVYRAG